MGREPQFRKLILDGSPADNEVLAFNSGDSTWKNQTAAEAGLAALSGALFTGNVTIIRSDAGTIVNLEVENTDNTNPASHARMFMDTGGSSGGDPFLLFRVAAAGILSMGLDNSQGDALVMSNNVTLGTNNVFSMVITTGAITLFSHITLHITDTDGSIEGQLWYDASEDKLKFKTAAGVETITST